MTLARKGAVFSIPRKTTSAIVKAFSYNAFTILKITYFRTRPAPFTFSALLLSFALRMSPLKKIEPFPGSPGTGNSPKPVTAPPIPGHPPAPGGKQPDGPEPEEPARTENQEPSTYNPEPAPAAKVDTQAPEHAPETPEPPMAEPSPDAPEAAQGAGKPSPDAPEPGARTRCQEISILKAKQIIEDYLLSNLDKPFYHIALTFAEAPESKKEALAYLSRFTAMVKNAGYKDFAYIAVPHKTDELFSMHIHLVYTSSSLTPETIAREYWPYGYVTVNRKVDNASPASIIKAAQKLSKYLLKDCQAKEKSQKVFITSSNLKKNYKEYFFNIYQLENLENALGELAATQTVQAVRLSNIKENRHSLIKDIVSVTNTAPAALFAPIAPPPQEIAEIRKAPCPIPGHTKSSALIASYSLTAEINSGFLNLKYITNEAAKIFPALSSKTIIKTAILLRKAGIFPVPVLDPLLIALYTPPGNKDLPVNPANYPAVPILNEPLPEYLLKYMELYSKLHKTGPP
jgi:hypothetical protein